MACQFNSPGPAVLATPPPPATPIPSPFASLTPSPSPSSSPGRSPSVTASPSPAPSPSPTPAPFSFRTSAGLSFSSVQLQQANPADFSQAAGLPNLDPGQIANLEVAAGLSGDQRYFLLRYGFVAIPSGDEHFKFIRRSVSTVDGQPYYLTTDAAFHALHVAYNDLLPALESEVLRPQLLLLLQALYNRTSQLADQASGGDLEPDVLLARDTCALALKLLDPALVLDPALEQRLAPQLAQIEQAEGLQPSLLIPGFSDDFSAYRPSGHYNASPTLQAYFRSLTWLSRAVLPLRSAALLTLALRDADANGRPAWQVWAEIHEILDFTAGPRLNPGPLELNALLGQAYGGAYSLADLDGSQSWQALLSNAPGFASGIDTPSGPSHWSLFGLHFSLEGQMLRQLGALNPQNQPPPGGLDLAAALGSPAARQYLQVTGLSRSADYPAAIAGIQAGWLDHFGSAWLYALAAQLASKDAHFPAHMGTLPWAYQDITSALGSWTEFKDDTLYPAPPPAPPAAPTPGGPPYSPPAPGYVEPEPDVFFRLAYASQALCQGLEQRGADRLAVPGPDSLFSFQVAFKQLCQLSQQLEQFGGIALKELRGESLTSADFGVIQTCLELKECFDRGEYLLNGPEPDPLPAIAVVASARDKVIQAGTGQLNRIYVVVPLEGKLEVAQGGVFSYYEFKQNQASPLTDEGWQARLASGPPSLAGWQLKYLVPGGRPASHLAFRVGDIYMVGPRGYAPAVRLFADPDPGAEVLARLNPGLYFEISDGPRLVGSQRWWKIRPALSPDDFPPGWVPENQAWFVRSHP